MPHDSIESIINCLGKLYNRVPDNDSSEYHYELTTLPRNWLRGLNPKQAVPIQILFIQLHDVDTVFFMAANFALQQGALEHKYGS